MSAWDAPRRYRSDDRDLDGHDVDLMIRPPDGNGDWYVAVVPHGARGGLAVRVTTSGTPAGQHGVSVAVANLYRAMGGEDSESLAPFSFGDDTDLRAALAEAEHDLEHLRAAARAAVTRDLGRDPGEVKTGDLAEHLWAMARPGRGELANARARAGAALVEAREALARIPLRGAELRRQLQQGVVDQRLAAYAAARAAEVAGAARSGGEESARP